MNASKIPGWFSKYDTFLFSAILEEQSRAAISGNLLEIGVYAGKSAVLIGKFKRPEDKFLVCDIFDGQTDHANKEEILRSYPDLSRTVFEKNCNQYLGYLPEIFAQPSGELESFYPKEKFRFAHVDGSHLRQHVKKDLMYVSDHIDSAQGIVVVDDYRAQHTFGVALSVWEAVSSFDLIPIFMTAAKIYLAKPDTKFEVKRITTKLIEAGIPFVKEEFEGREIVRLIGMNDEEIYGSRHPLGKWLPPVLFKTLSWLKKKII